MRLIKIWGLLLFFSLTPAVFSWYQPSEGPTWFQLKGESALDWAVMGTGSPDRYLIESRQQLDGSQYRVLVLFPKKSSAYDTALSQILEVFHDKRLTTVFTLINFEGDPELGKEALAYARKNNFDLIFSMGSVSTSFLVEHFQGENTPIVTVCSKDPVLMGQISDYQGSKTNIAFTSLDVPIESQMAYLKQLVKNLKNIVVLYARNNTSAVKTQVEPLREFCAREGINVVDGVVENQATAKEELAEKLPQIVAQIKDKDPRLEESILWITGSTSVFREIETINQFAGGVPVLSAMRNVVSAGDNSAVLSIGVSFENNAQIAAIYGFQILTKKATAGELKVGVVSPPDLAINFKKAREFNLKIPFNFFESASFIYDAKGRLVRAKGQRVTPKSDGI